MKKYFLNFEFGGNLKL